MPESNPYQPPQTPPTGPRSGRHVVAMVLLILLAIPAGIVAFFVTCLATATVANEQAAVYGGAITGLFVTAVILYFAVFGTKRKAKPPGT